MKRLVVYDLSSFIFRAFFAIRPLNAPDGTPVNAVYGVLNMLLNSFEELSPTHLFIAQDTKGGSFRNELYSEYKANRSAPPEELVPQFAIIEELIDQLGIKKLKIDGFEADDIIGSSVTQFEKSFDEILIASSDKDLMQFVNGNIKMVDTMKNKLYGKNEVFEKMGVYPEQIMDYLSLVGDSSDNIPGVKGIGAKGAAKLLEDYGDLDTIFKNIDKITNKRVLTGLTEYKDNAYLSKKLVEIRTDLKLGVKANELEYQFKPTKDLVQLLEKLNFKSTVKKLDKIAELPTGTVSKEATPSSQKLKKEKPHFTLSEETVSDIHHDVSFFPEQFDSFLKSLRNNVEIGLAWEGDTLAVSTASVKFSFKSDHIKEDLKKILEKKLCIYCFEPKKYMKIGLELNFEIQAELFDISLAHFNIDPGSSHKETLLNQNYLGADVADSKEEAADITFYRRARNTLPLGQKIKNELGDNKVFYEIDQVLNPVLAEIEYTGIKVNKATLTKLENEYSEISEDLQKKIYKAAGGELNLNSPKQVGELLFEKLNLPVIKKTKTGYSTDQSVLSKLDEMGVSPIPGMLLTYRETEKLLSTYIRTLPDLIDENKRIHTHLNQDVAATGRLSSDNPNLQNIPIRTEAGRKIRKAFVAEKGCQLIAADYSQVELRLLAHFCGDKTMIKAFLDDKDVHAQTASEVFGIPVEGMPKDIRNKAKAINFGLIYGQSSFGLAESLGISRTEAKEYITHYFHKFSSVKAYLDSLRESAEKTGYAETLMGRKRLIPEIQSQNRAIKSMGERLAINSPIQGTAADIIKLAMINIDKELKKKKLGSKMILQVHDELIFEVPDKEVELMKKLIKDGMENVVKLKVPLKVDISVASNWYDLK